jgi:5-oxoprolinase (ATP-hydrolysing) subunit A
MSRRDAIDINVDMGESFGRWSLGDDAGIMPFISSASIACGFHAGDPRTMRKTVALAVEHGVHIGAHVALPDLLGFGRRPMTISPEDLTDYCTFQIGALAAFVQAEGGTLRHVKPHGALYAMCYRDPELAEAVARSIAEVDPELLLLLLRDDVSEAAARHGVRLVTEAFVDLDYDADGELIIEAVKTARDPEEVAERAVRLVREGKLTKTDGSDFDVDVSTFCLHGDAPNAVDVARTVRERLQAEGIAVRPLVELVTEPTQR